jgi:hypothetical protein
MSDEKIHEAACACGALTATAKGDPVRISMCHCLECQRRSGSVFGAQARWPADKVTVRGPSTTWSRTGDSGGVITNRFCPTCGSTIAYSIDRVPGFTVIPIGAFADPTIGAPVFSVYEARKHPWVDLTGLAMDHLE